MALMVWSFTDILEGRMMKKRNLQWLILGMLVGSVCLLANAVQAQGFMEIKAKELKKMMDSGEKILLINPLSDIEFNDKHIPGSVNISLYNILITEKLPKDKDQLIVTYCLGRK